MCLLKGSRRCQGEAGTGPPCPAVPSVPQKGADVHPAPPAGGALPPAVVSAQLPVNLPSDSRLLAAVLQDPVSRAAAPTCLSLILCPDHKMLAYATKLAEAQEGSSVSPEPSVPRGQGHTRPEHSCPEATRPASGRPHLPSSTS